MADAYWDILLEVTGSSALSQRVTILDEDPWICRDLISEIEYMVRKEEEILVRKRMALDSFKSRLNNQKRRLLKMRE